MEKLDQLESQETNDNQASTVAPQKNHSNAILDRRVSFAALGLIGLLSSGINQCTPPEEDTPTPEATPIPTATPTALEKEFYKELCSYPDDLFYIEGQGEEFKNLSITDYTTVSTLSDENICNIAANTEIKAYTIAVETNDNIHWGIFFNEDLLPEYLNVVFYDGNCPYDLHTKYCGDINDIIDNSGLGGRQIIVLFSENGENIYNIGTNFVTSYDPL